MIMFEDLLASYNTYFRMDVCRSDDMNYYLQFKFIENNMIYEFEISRVDMECYSKNKIPKSIQFMILDLNSTIRDLKINQILCSK